MGDFVRANAGDLLTALSALLVAGFGVLFAEGGRQRRRLNRVNVTLEVIKQMRDLRFAPDHRTELKRRIDVDLQKYLLTRRQRWVRRYELAGFSLLAASGLYVVADVVGVILDAAPLSPLSVALLKVVLLAGAVLVAGIVLVALCIVGFRRSSWRKFYAHYRRAKSEKLWENAVREERWHETDNSPSTPE